MEPDERDEILRTLVRIAVNQNTINERLTAAIDRLDVTLAAIKDILGRLDGR